MVAQRLANIVFLVLVLVVSAYFAWLAEGFKAVGLLASSGLPSKFFPQLMLAFMGACAVVVLAAYIAKGTALEGEGEHVYAGAPEAMRGILTLIVMVVGYFIWQAWGYVAMAVFLGPACCAAMGVRNPVIYVVVLALAAVVYLIFTQLLGTRFDV